jgi:hypothetical protein
LWLEESSVECGKEFWKSWMDCSGWIDL